MTDRKLLAEHKLWARDGWATRGSRNKRRASAPSVLRSDAESTPRKPRASPNKPATAHRLGHATESATPNTETAPMVAKLNLDAWIGDAWAAPVGTKRERKPAVQLNVPRQMPLPRQKSTSERKLARPLLKFNTRKPETKKRKRHGAPSEWDAVPAEAKSEDEDEEDEPAPEKLVNYAAHHNGPDTLMYHGSKRRVKWGEMFDYLSFKGWRAEKSRLVNGAQATVYFAPKGKRKDDGGKLGRDYFLSPEGVLHHLEKHPDILRDFFD